MKRIAFLGCAVLFLLSNTAEARRYRGMNGGNYTQPVQVAPASYSSSPTPSVEASPVSYSTSPAPSVPATPASYSTSTAQGVANIMAARNTVGHFGGNPGYEGCGCGATPAAAYNICCYGQSGMTTVDVGYARSANGMWYCCRRYR